MYGDIQIFVFTLFGFDDKLNRKDVVCGRESGRKELFTRIRFALLIQSRFVAMVPLMNLKNKPLEGHKREQQRESFKDV